MFIYTSPAVFLNERLDQPPGSFLILDITENCQQSLLLTDLDHTEVSGHVETVSVRNVSIGCLHIHIVDMPGYWVGPHGLHFSSSGCFWSYGVVQVQSVTHFSKLVLRLFWVFPRTLHYVKGLPLSLEVIEELRVGEEESEKVINIDGKGLADNLSCILALPPHLIGEDVLLRAGQGSWWMARNS